MPYIFNNFSVNTLIRGNSFKYICKPTTLHYNT